MLLADIILTTVYTPRESLLDYYLAGAMLMALTTLAISAPLWFAWRLMGATLHYARLLVVLLHQVSIVQLVAFVAGAIIAGGLELRSINSVDLAVDEAMKQASVPAALEVLANKLPSLFDGSEVLIASGLGIGGDACRCGLGDQIVGRLSRRLWLEPLAICRGASSLRAHLLGGVRDTWLACFTAA